MFRIIASIGAALIGVATAQVVVAPASHANPPGITGYQVITGDPADLVGATTVIVSVSCPSGQSVVGGGASAHSPLAWISSSYPATTSSWSVAVTMPVDLGYTEHFTPYAVCVDTSSVPGITIASSGDLAVPAATNVISGVQCPSGDVALDGGFAGGNGLVRLTESAPEPGEPDIWLVGVYEASSTDPGEFSIDAVCVPSSDLTDYTVQSTSYGDFGTLLDQPISGSSALTNTAGAPYCPAGDVAVGAGAVVHDQNNSYVSSLIPAPQGDPHYWLETSTDANPPSGYSESAEANDICVNGTVAPIATTTTLAITPPNPTLNQTVTLTATVTPASGTTVPQGTVQFYDNGVLIGSSSVNNSGQAVITYRFGAGSHSIVAKYLGDTVDTPNFAPSQSSPVTFSIGCTTTVTGTHSALTASSGLTCVTNATITGGITVASGAQIDIEHSTISGGVAISGSGAARICASTMSSLTVSGATGYVMVGDPANGCAGNTIKGGVTIANNKGGGSLINNKITGSTTVANNNPAWTVSGNHA